MDGWINDKYVGRQIDTDIDEREIDYRNWLMLLEVPWGTSASWRPRKAGGVIHSESEPLRAMSADGWGQEKMDVSTQFEGERVCSSSVFFFCPGHRRMGWYPPVWVRVIFFTQFPNSNVSLFQKHPPRHTQESCFTSSSGIPQPRRVDT